MYPLLPSKYSLHVVFELLVSHESVALYVKEIPRDCFSIQITQDGISTKGEGGVIILFAKLVSMSTRLEIQHAPPSFFVFADFKTISAIFVISTFSFIQDLSLSVSCVQQLRSAKSFCLLLPYFLKAPTDISFSKLEVGISSESLTTNSSQFFIFVG